MNAIKPVIISGYLIFTLVFSLLESRYSVTIEAASEDEAQMIAAAMVDNADYIMIQGCY